MKKGLFVIGFLIAMATTANAQPRVDSVWHATQYIDSSIIELEGAYIRCQMETWKDSRGKVLGYLHDTGLLETFVSRDTVPGTKVLNIFSWSAHSIIAMGKKWVLYKMSGMVENRALLYSDRLQCNIEFVFPGLSPEITNYTGAILQTYIPEPGKCDWTVFSPEDKAHSKGYCLKNGWISKAIFAGQNGKPFVIK